MRGTEKNVGLNIEQKRTFLATVFCAAAARRAKSLDAGGGFCDNAAMQMEQVLKNFGSKGFKAFYFKDAGAAKRFISETIGNGATVGMGGSVTVSELGLYELLSKGNKVYWHGAPDRDENTMRNAAAAEYYVSSANALGAGGEIVNIDGRGNRVASTFFGPNRKAVFIVCGENKLAENLEKAIWRAKNIAAPLNAKRLGRKTPCAAKGDKCYNCASPERICCATTIMTNPTFCSPCYVIIISGSYGY